MLNLMIGFVRQIIRFSLRKVDVVVGFVALQTIATSRWGKDGTNVRPDNSITELSGA